MGCYMNLNVQALWVLTNFITGLDASILHDLVNVDKIIMLAVVVYHKLFIQIQKDKDELSTVPETKKGLEQDGLHEENENTLTWVLSRLLKLSKL
jgi:hypothetical protein